MSEKVYVIIDTRTGGQLTCRSGKSSWNSVGAAKNAFNNHLGYYDPQFAISMGLQPVSSEGSWPRLKPPKFSEQSVYIVRELKTTIASDFEKAVTLLKEAYRCGVGSEELYAEIRGFLKGLK